MYSTKKDRCPLPPCHNSQAPAFPACEKKARKGSKNPRNPLSWVRPFPQIIIVIISPPNQFKSIQIKSNIIPIFLSTPNIIVQFTHHSSFITSTPLTTHQLTNRSQSPFPVYCLVRFKLSNSHYGHQVGLTQRSLLPLLPYTIHTLHPTLHEHPVVSCEPVIQSPLGLHRNFNFFDLVIPSDPQHNSLLTPNLTAT